MNYITKSYWRFLSPWIIITTIIIGVVVVQTAYADTVTNEDTVYVAPFVVQFNQDFEDFPPAGWQNLYRELNDEEAEFSSPSSDSWRASRFRNLSDAQISARIHLNVSGFPTYRWLIMPPVDLGDGSESFGLEFDFAVTVNNTTTPSQLGPNDLFAVLISEDGGETWYPENILLSLSENDDDDFARTETLSVDLSEYSGTVHLAFYAGRSSGSLPNINVHVGNISTTITSDKADLSVSRTEIDFGTIAANETDQRSFQVSNRGNIPMDITMVSSSESFVILGETSRTINAGEESNVNVQFAPGPVENDFDETITIDAGEAFNSPQTIVLTGSSVFQPRSRVSITDIDEQVSQGDDLNITFDISNIGTGPLEYYLSPQIDENALLSGEIESHDNFVLTQPASQNLVFTSEVSISFESEEGFELGFIGRQQGWAAFDNNISQPEITDAKSSSGNNALVLSYDQELDNIFNTAAFSPLFFLDGDEVEILIDVNVEDVDASFYDIAFQAVGSSSALLTSRVRFDTDGFISILSPNDQGDLEFDQTDINYELDEWATLKLVMNKTENTITYFYNDDEIYKMDFFSANYVNQIVFLRDNKETTTSLFSQALKTPNREYSIIK